MKATTADAIVYPSLALTTSLFALVLDHNHQHAAPDARWEPDGTVLEVIFGTGMCLLAASLRTRLEGETARDAERATWLAFTVGGLPITIWQAARAYQRQKQRGDWQERTTTHDNHTPRPAQAVAAWRAPHSAPNGAHRDGR